MFLFSPPDIFVMINFGASSTMFVSTWKILFLENSCSNTFELLLANLAVIVTIAYSMISLLMKLKSKKTMELRGNLTSKFKEIQLIHLNGIDFLLHSVKTSVQNFYLSRGKNEGN